MYNNSLGQSKTLTWSHHLEAHVDLFSRKRARSPPDMWKQVLNSEDSLSKGVMLGMKNSNWPLSRFGWLCWCLNVAQKNIYELTLKTSPVSYLTSNPHLTCPYTLPYPLESSWTTLRNINLQVLPVFSSALDIWPILPHPTPVPFTWPIPILSLGHNVDNLWRP